MRKLSNWLEAYLQYNENTEPPKVYHKWVAVSIIAAVLRRKTYLPWGGLTFYPNFYIVLVGPPGRCRKGTSMSVGYSLLRELGIKMAAESTTREALIRALKEASDSQVDPLRGTLALHSSLTIFSPELTVFLGYNNHQLMSDLTDWFDCREKWTYRTKNMGTDDIDGVFVNLIGATTPDLVQSTLPLDAIGGGLTSRMIFVYADKKYKTIPVPYISPEMASLRNFLFHDLEQISMLQGPFRVTKNFTERWVDWYTKADHSSIFKDPRLAGYEERRPTHILKLSMIMSVFRDQQMLQIVTEDDLDMAISFLEEAEKNMLKTFGGMGKSPDAYVTEQIATYIASNKNVTRAELMERYRRDLDVTGLDNVLNTLETALLIRKVYTKDHVLIQSLSPEERSKLLRSEIEHSKQEDQDGTH